MQDDKLNNLIPDSCIKCNLCSSVCPMMEVNPTYPGPKQAGPDGFRYRLKDPTFFDNSLAYCLNCKRCEVACPSNVHVADIIQLAKLRYGKRHHQLRNWALSHTDDMGHLVTPVAPIVNWGLHTPLAPKALALIGIASNRTFPTYTKETFVHWFKRHAEAEQQHYKRHITYFHGCYVNYNNPAQGRALLTLLNACGIGMHLIEGERCCGVALMANGEIKDAQRNAQINIKLIHDLTLTTSPSCTLMMRDEYADVLGIDNSAVRDYITLATKWLYEQIEAGTIHLVFRSDYRQRVFYHIPCHLQRLGWASFTIGLMRLIPGLELIVPEQQCCGIAGTFGFKQENTYLADQIGEKLFTEIREADPDLIVTDCETCRWQLEMHINKPIVHPLDILLQALDIPKTQQANETNI